MADGEKLDQFERIMQEVLADFAAGRPSLLVASKTNREAIEAALNYVKSERQKRLNQANAAGAPRKPDHLVTKNALRLRRFRERRGARPSPVRSEGLAVPSSEGE